jgi:signal transduction histidine kinase
LDRTPFIFDSDSRFNLPLTSIKSNERTEVIHGSSNVLDREILFFSNSRVKVNTYMDSSRPALALGIESIKKSFIDARDRKVKLRYITDIKPENISYCKELMEIAEVRHLDGIKGNFMVSEKEYIAPLSSPGSEVASQIIYSNLWEMVSQQNYIFDTLWNKAVPVVRRFKEIEEGIGPIDTRLLEDSDEIFNHLKHVIENSSKRLLCSKSGAMQLVYNNFFDQYKKIVDMQKRGEGEGIRWITTVNNANKDLIKLFLNAGVKIRHLKNLPPMNFAIDDKYFHETIENMEDGKITRSLLTSNEPIYINHYNSIFEELWKNGIEAEQKIRDIEEGADLADIEVFPNAPRAREVYLNLVEAATKEILFIFPTPNAFTRQSKIGAVGLAKKAAAERDVKVRILMPAAVPANNFIDRTFQNLTPDHDHKLDVRYIEQMSETKATILVIDRKESLVMELRDDSKDTFDEAIGLSTYSNSKAGVLSYVAIFDNLWDQTKLYEQIKDSNTKLELANEQLQIQDKAQQEFINIAAHELRTPIQPILGLSGLLLHHKQTEEKRQQLLGVIVRNAKRLERLTENILDITRIESKSLKLEKEIFNLSEMLRDAAADFQNQIDKEEIVSASRKLEFIGLEEDLLVKADKDRIHQVISNLLSNAIKFTDEGKVSISATKFDDRIVVGVKDTGSGIDSKILPKLFTKFATNSVTGTGLGLFISKNIIEAHGGHMWGENNTNGRGAAFSFSLPSINRKIAKNN